MRNHVCEKVGHAACTGCGACIESCPQKALCFVQDEKGFSYPAVDEEICSRCGLCLEKCHVYKQDVINHKEQDGYGFKHYVKGVRENSSSGGAFTLLSDYILQHHGVVYGAVFSFDPIANVRHARATTVEQRNAMRGAKYVQSDTHAVFPQVKEDLNNGKKVLFTGTPCQVAGLKKYLGEKYCENLLLCDIICHSVPSPQLFQDHIKLLEQKKGSKVIGYSCREKRFGWTRRDCAYYADGSQEHSSMRSQLCYLLFNTHLANRPSCANCLYAGAERVGDFTIGDFWGVEHSFKDHLGVSALLVNTDKGREVFGEIKMPGWIQEQTVSQIFTHNHRKPISPNPETDKFWADYCTRGYTYVMRKYLHYHLCGKCVFWFKNKTKSARRLLER